MVKNDIKFLFFTRIGNSNNWKFGLFLTVKLYSNNVVQVKNQKAKGKP